MDHTITAVLGAAALAMATMVALTVIGARIVTEQTDTWSWSDDVLAAQSRLHHAFTNDFTGYLDGDTAPLSDAFSDLLAVLDTPGGSDQLVDAVRSQVALAEASLQTQQVHHGEALDATAQLQQALTGVTGLIADELTSVRLDQAQNETRSINAEHAQRTQSRRLQDIAVIIVAAERVRDKIGSVMDLDTFGNTDRIWLARSGLPAPCDVNLRPIGPSQGAPIQLCSPNSQRLHVLIDKFEAATPGADRARAGRFAYWAAEAYLRSLRTVFEQETRAMMIKTDQIQVERRIGATLAQREGALQLLLAPLGEGSVDPGHGSNGAHDPHHGHGANGSLGENGMFAQQLPGGGQGSTDVTRFIDALRDIGLGLFAREQVGLNTANAMIQGVEALDAASAREITATARQRQGAAELQIVLANMEASLVAFAEASRASAKDELTRFITLAVVGTCALGGGVFFLILLAYGQVALPIRNVTRSLLQISRGRTRVPIDVARAPAYLQPLFAALEQMRQTASARDKAQTEAAVSAEALRLAHVRLTRIANDAPVALFVYIRDADGNTSIPYASETYREMFSTGAATGSALVKAVHDQIHDDDRDDLFGVMRDSLRDLSAMNTRFRVNHPERGEIWVTTSARPTREPDGSTQWVGMLMDTTLQVQYEARLDQARESAEHANAAKSMFLANMSHEIRTPMNGIMGMCDLLLDTPLSSEQRLFSRTISESAESLLLLINDVLDFSKVEAGKMVLQPEPLALHELTYDVCRLLGPKAGAKGLRLVVDVDHDMIGDRIGDHGRLRQILINLVGNAVKFTKEGQVTVALAPAHLSGPDGPMDGVTLSVTDTGIGIAKEAQSAIFHAFEQEDGEHTRGFDGTGLGLAISTRLAELMGGSITVQSEPGQGSTFTVELPLPIQPGAAAIGAGLKGALEGQTVVFARGGADERQVVGEQLAYLGARVLRARTGEAVLDLVQSGTEDAVYLLSESLPDMALSNLRKHLLDTSGNPLPTVTCLGLSQMQATQNDGVVMRAPAALPTLLDAVRQATGATRASQGGDRSPQGAGDAGDAAAPDTQLRIFAADDNRTNRLVLRKMMDKLPVDLTLFENGADIVAATETALADNAAPDLILMDLSMPEMGGLEASRRIRDMEPADASPIPIVALTANALSQHRVSCHEAGMTDFLTKPVKKAQLSALIEAHKAGDVTPMDEEMRKLA